MSLKFQYLQIPLSDTVEIFSKKIPVNALPKGVKLMEDLGLAGSTQVSGSLLYRSNVYLFEVRGTITPNGDYLVMFPAGDHYAACDKKGNTIMALRSKDKGQTWSNPYIAFKNIDFNQHAFIPYIPKNSKRIYSYGTQPVWGLYTRDKGLREDAPLGYFYSDDDGFTWKGPEIISPVNAPGLLGISVMRLCETNKGTLIFSVSDNIVDIGPTRVSQYILRSEDAGKSWELIPEYKGILSGWNIKPMDFMGEGVPLQVGDRVVMLERMPEGHIWAMWSDDDGKTWTDPVQTSLVHPDAPPMAIVLSDKKTILALHHNRDCTSKKKGFDFENRSEVWVSFSQDCGKTWSESSFLFCNAAKPDADNTFLDHQCSYLDMFIDGDTLNIWVPHRWRQVVHLQIKEKDLFNLPKRSDLGL